MKNTEPGENNPKKPAEKKSKSQTLNSLNSENSEKEKEKEKEIKIISPYAETERLYTIDDMIDMWCRGATNGATLWQYCQDTKKQLPSSFEAGLIELTNNVRDSGDKAHALKAVSANNMILLGVFEELQ